MAAPRPAPSHEPRPAPERAELADIERPPRPTTRGECVAGVRPCPWISCRHHLAVSGVTGTGRVIVNERALEPGHESCALDVADRGPIDNVAEVAAHAGLTRQGGANVLERALHRVRRRLRLLDE